MGRNKTDYEEPYDPGVKAGNGSEQERTAYREILRT